MIVYIVELVTIVVYSEYFECVRNFFLQEMKKFVSLIFERFKLATCQWWVSYMLQNQMKGLSLDDSIKATNKEYAINENEDLNKVDDETLQKKKAGTKSKESTLCF